MHETPGERERRRLLHLGVTPDELPPHLADLEPPEPPPPPKLPSADQGPRGVEERPPLDINGWFRAFAANTPPSRPMR
jgi:hypothetical protein